MRTPYGKLAVLTLVLIAAFMLFMPMRSGIEDRLYAAPQSVNLRRGETYAIQVRLESTHQQVVKYSSVNEAVARVNKRGVITAVSAGTTDIHMIAEDGARGLVHVKVVGSPVTSLALNTETLNMEKGQVSGLSVQFNDTADEKLVEWISEDESVATVDALGRVTAVGGGKTRVIATTPGGVSASAEVSVHVDGKTMHITPEGLHTGVGAAVRMGASYFPDDATDEVVRWESNNPAVATIGNDGILHAVAEGTAVISGFSKAGLGGSTIITVEQPAAQFSISPTAATIERGETLNLTAALVGASGLPEEATAGHYIQWTSSNPKVASVVDGVVTGLRSGTVRITASADGMSAECNLRVQVLVHEVTFNAREIYLLREQTDSSIQLVANISPADPDNPKLTYATDNDLVANVNQNGLITLTGGYGTAIITATADGGAQARFAVNVVVELPERLSDKVEETPEPAVYAVAEDEIREVPLDETLAPTPEPTPVSEYDAKGSREASYKDVQGAVYDIFGDRVETAVTPIPDQIASEEKSGSDDSEALDIDEQETFDNAFAEDFGDMDEED